MELTHIAVIFTISPPGGAGGAERRRVRRQLERLAAASTRQTRPAQQVPDQPLQRPLQVVATTLPPPSPKGRQQT